MGDFLASQKFRFAERRRVFSEKTTLWLRLKISVSRNCMEITQASEVISLFEENNVPSKWYTHLTKGEAMERYTYADYKAVQEAEALCWLFANPKLEAVIDEVRDMIRDVSRAFTEENHLHDGMSIEQSDAFGPRATAKLDKLIDFLVKKVHKSFARFKKH